MAPRTEPALQDKMGRPQSKADKERSERQSQSLTLASIDPSRVHKPGDRLPSVFDSSRDIGIPHVERLPSPYDPLQDSVPVKVDYACEVVRRYTNSNNVQVVEIGKVGKVLGFKSDEKGEELVLVMFPDVMFPHVTFRDGVFPDVRSAVWLARWAVRGYALKYEDWVTASKL